MYLVLSPVVLLLSAVLSYLLLMLWYSPAVFGPNTFFNEKKSRKSITLYFIAFSFLLFSIFTLAFSVLLSASILLKISPLPILAATIASYLFSMLWYSPFLFGRYFQVEKKEERSSTIQLIGAFLLSLLFCWGFAILLQWLSPSSLSFSVFIAIISWLGFSVSKHLRVALWDPQNTLNSWIHIGADLFKFIIVTVVINSINLMRVA